MTDSFFEEPLEQSLVKATIVQKYFWAWTKVIVPWAKQNRSQKVAYLDLFAGPGYYQDGTRSTPILILERALQEADLRQMLVAVFNDAKPEHAYALRDAIDALPGVGALKYPPVVLNREVDVALAETLRRNRLVPTLLFADPWGYKGLSLQLIGSVLKDWGCDCILFFNYNRINMGLGNDYVREHMDAILGRARADALRGRLPHLQPDERELSIIEEMADALKELGGTYVLPFRFRDDQGTRTSHHLMFVSKHVLGYKIMKEIMAARSSSVPQGVPSFEYNLADKRFPVLFEYARPLDQLEQSLVDHFAGRRVTMLKVFQEHNIGTPFIKSNYKEALKRLERDGKIAADPPAERRKRNTFADEVLVTFPPRRA